MDYDSFDLVVVTDRTLDRAVIKNSRPCRFCIEDVRQAELFRRIYLRVIEHRTAEQILLSEMRLEGRDLIPIQSLMLSQIRLTGEPIVHREPDREFRSRHKARVVKRQDEAKRPDQIGRDPEQYCTLSEIHLDQSEVELFEIAKSAMDQPRRSCSCPAAEVVLFEQHDAHPAQSGV